MKVVVTGAAGFIGSVVTEHLVQAGHSVIAVDNLKYGHENAVDPQARFRKGDVTDRAFCQSVITTDVDAVVHLAAEAYIDESVADPGLFFDVNTLGGLNILDSMSKAGVKRLLFSSTAAVYGEPVMIPIEESNPLQPVNPYGESKLQFERMLPWFHRAHGLNYVCFRYFNACGATSNCGEDRKKETHIIPILFDVVTGKRPQFSLFGNDYDTPDGTCIRDYVHVSDIANAHLLALENVDRVKQQSYNLGSGVGFSNLQMIDAVKHVTGKEIDYVVAPRRAGDPSRLVASYGKIHDDLGWSPSFTSPMAMMATSWAWRQEHPCGYPS